MGVCVCVCVCVCVWEREALILKRFLKRLNEKKNEAGIRPVWVIQQKRRVWKEGQDKKSTKKWRVRGAAGERDAVKEQKTRRVRDTLVNRGGRGKWEHKEQHKSGAFFLSYLLSSNLDLWDQSLQKLNFYLIKKVTELKKQSRKAGEPPCKPHWTCILSSSPQPFQPVPPMNQAEVLAEKQRAQHHRSLCPHQTSRCSFQTIHR